VLVKVKPRRPEKNLMPIWLQIICVLLLLVFAALFSGLTLGLMGLDPNELRMIIRSGTGNN
jgi:metal transporter CNNM